ncbi:MAG: hypothetical protein ABGY42_02620 [bacterium]
MSFGSQPLFVPEEGSAAEQYDGQALAQLQSVYWQANSRSHANSHLP